MKTRAWLAVLILATFSGSALAIDRDAAMIDTVQLEMSDLNDMDAFGGSVWGETAFLVPTESWSCLFGFGYSEISPDFDRDNFQAWTGGLGLKYYITRFTSVSGVGTYTDYNKRAVDDKDAKAGTLGLKHRFLAPNDPVCPFIKLSYTWRERSTFTEFDPPLEEDIFTEHLGTISGGAEFAMREELSMVFDIGYVMAEASDNKIEDLDGFFANIGMQYYWWPSED